VSEEEKLGQTRRNGIVTMGEVPNSPAFYVKGWITTIQERKRGNQGKGGG